MPDLLSGPIAEPNREDEIRQLDELLRRASEYLLRPPSALLSARKRNPKLPETRHYSNQNQQGPRRKF